MTKVFSRSRQATVIILLLFLPFVLLAQSQATLQPKTIEKSYFQYKDAAIRGYDPVAYFNENSAQKGDTAFSLKWEGATWYFKNEANRDAFKSSPEKFAPQYGGYCAYGVSENHKSPTDPSAFTIVDGKLYLNYSSKVKELWLKDKEGRIPKANALWPALISVQ